MNFIAKGNKDFFQYMAGLYTYFKSAQMSENVRGYKWVIRDVSWLTFSCTTTTTTQSNGGKLKAGFFLSNTALCKHVFWQSVCLSVCGTMADLEYIILLIIYLLKWRVYITIPRSYCYTKQMCFVLIYLLMW